MVVRNDISRIGLIGASFNTGNMGVGALAAGAIRCLRRSWPQADIYILDYGKEPKSTEVSDDQGSGPVHSVNIRFSKKVYLSNNIALLLLVALIAKAIPLSKLRRRLLSSNRTLRQLSRTSIFAAISGGDSFSDIYGLRRLLYVSLPQILVILLGKRLVLLPQTFGPFNSRLSRVVARTVIRNAESVYARDRKSLEVIESIVENRKGKSDPVFRYDVGFALQARAPERIEVSSGFSPNEAPVGLNVSGLLYMGGYRRNNMFGLRVPYQELISKALEILIVKKGASVLLLPHVFGDEANPESDVTACEAVYNSNRQRYGERLGILNGTYDQSEIKHIIGICDFFIGSRMHACIAAISQAVPAVAVAYSDKFIGVMRTVELPYVVADARRLSLDEMLAHIEAVYDDRSRLRQQLQEHMPQVCEQALQLFRPVEARGFTSSALGLAVPAGYFGRDSVLP
jgi:colanic acid/amylovoran biosynthesis protein